MQMQKAVTATYNSGVRPGFWAAAPISGLSYILVASVAVIGLLSEVFYAISSAGLDPDLLTSSTVIVVLWCTTAMLLVRFRTTISAAVLMGVALYGLFVGESYPLLWLTVMAGLVAFTAHRAFNIVYLSACTVWMLIDLAVFSHNLPASLFIVAFNKSSRSRKNGPGLPANCTISWPTTSR